MAWLFHLRWLCINLTTMVRPSYQRRPCSSLYHHDATVSSTSVMQQCLPPWFDRLINVDHVAMFITMARPPHQRRPCSNIYHHGATASSTSSVCWSTNMVLTASLTSHMWESITVVATVPLKLSHVKYNHSNNRLIKVVHAEHTRIITKSSFDCLIYVDGAQFTKEFVYQKEQRHVSSIV